jgi:nitroreductase
MRYNVSEILAVIRDRRTIAPEKYSARKVHREIVEQLLTNATWAPNHGLTQPWRFTVFMDGAQLEMAARMAQLYRDHAKHGGKAMNETAALKLAERGRKASVIVALGLAHDAAGKFPEWEDRSALAAAVQNMYLTATAHGIGAFWSTPGFIGEPGMRELLGWGDDVQCAGIFYLGYPEGDWPKSHRKPLEYVTKWVRGGEQKGPGEKTVS